MSKRQQWWAWEIISWLMLILVVALLPELAWWKYLLLGVAIGIYAVCYRKQDRL